MTPQQIQLLISDTSLNDVSKEFKLIETHISWVILTKEYAFKIKKPIKYSFIDYSSKELRYNACQKELELNRRFAPDIYLMLRPVYLNPNSQISFETNSGKVLDYAIMMKRLPEDRQLDYMLHNMLVQPEHMSKLGAEIANFHLKTAPVSIPDYPKSILDDFCDIASYLENAGTFSPDLYKLIKESIHFASIYVKTNHYLLESRNSQGWIRDCHGDLHSGNIFLTDEPVLFDCIEFDDHFRHIDVLNELAFLIMDIESGKQKEMASPLLQSYLNTMKISLSPKLEELLNFYKLYRANVKLKINLVKPNQKGNPDLKLYMRTFSTYLNQWKVSS